MAKTKYKQLPFLIKEIKGHIKSAEDIYTSMKDIKSADKELFIVFALNANNDIIYREIVSIGIVDSAITHPREVFRNAIVNNASSIILCHNHPSGNVEPSGEDDNMTEKIKEAGVIIGIKVLDHVIVGKNNYYSYNDKNRLESKQSYYDFHGGDEN